MIYKESAMALRLHLGEMLNKIQYRGDSIVITKADKPVAALIDIELFERIKRMKVEYERLTDKLALTYANVDQRVAESEINEAVLVIRKKRKKTKE